MATSIYAALAAFFLIHLSTRVIRLRQAGRISVGAGGDPDLERAMRVHANFVEYTPLALLLLGLAELQGLPVWAVHLFGLALLGARAAHFVGFRSAAAPGRLRVAGMATTFGVLGCLGLILIAQTALGLGAP